MGHDGPCDEYPYLQHLGEVAPRVKAKIVRDATMTTGASWASEDAGPNRIQRWVMLLSDEQLLEYGINMAELKPQVVAKLREKAANYEDCMTVAQKLTALAYGMQNAPKAPPDIEAYLTAVLGIVNRPTVCQVCRSTLDFLQFDSARRGKAEIETAHANPRQHTAANVGFAHRECNIAQGSRSLDEFYTWIADILARVRRA